MDSSVGNLYHTDSDWPGCTALEQLVRALLPERAQFKLALDLGCGTGTRTKALFDLFPSLQKIVGIDKNASMIEVAKVQSADERINYLVHAIEDLSSLHLSGIDSVSAVYVLHWLEAKNALFAELNKITKPGALFLIATCNGTPSVYEQIDVMVKNHLQTELPIPFFFFNKTQWENLFAEWDWKILATKSNINESIVDNGMHCLVQWYAASAGRAFYGRRLDDFSKHFLNMMIEKLDSQYSQENGSWLFTEEDLLFVCQRL